MDANVVLNGSLRLKKGSTWRDQHDLEELSLVKHSTDSKNYGIHAVSFTVESVIPLHTVKLYSLTRQRYNAFTKSSILSDFLSQVYKPMSVFQQPKYALLICIRNNGLIPSNPFDDNEATYPLAKESYVLLIGRRWGEHPQDAISLQVFGQVLRDRFDYPNFYNLSHDVTVLPSLVLGDNCKLDNKDSGDDSTHDGVAESILQSYRPDLLSTSHQQHEHHEYRYMDSGHSHRYQQQRQQQSWKTLLKRDMDRLGKLDQLRDESRRSRPERTLTVVKRKHLPNRKSSNVAPPPLPSSTLKKSASASPLLPSINLKRQPSLPAHLSLQQSTKSTIPSTSSSLSSSQQQGSRTESSNHDTNKKQLKSAIWSKLLQVGHDKKAEDTKQLFHCIYQSMQYTLRKSFKSDLLDHQIMDSLIDSHIQFYSSLELPNDLL